MIKWITIDIKVMILDIILQNSNTSEQDLMLRTLFFMHCANMHVSCGQTNSNQFRAKLSKSSIVLVSYYTSADVKANVFTFT